MSIVVTCQCGKRFAAKPELAGKRVRCPACQSPLTIPASHAAAAPTKQQPAAPTRQQPVAATASLIVNCQCGQRFVAGAHLAGRELPCPACRQSLRVPLAAQSVPSQQSVATLGPSDDNFWNEVSALTPSLPSVPTLASLPLPQITQPAKPQRSSELENEYLAKAYAEDREKASDLDSWANGKIISGVVMILGSILWFCAGLAGGIIFFYPPILFVIGVIALINGLSYKLSR